MTPSAIPIRRLQDQQIDTPRECPKECRSGADPAASWKIIQKDGSRQETSGSQLPPGTSAPAAVSTLPQGLQETPPASTPGTGPVWIPRPPKRGLAGEDVATRDLQSRRPAGVRPVQRATQSKAAHPASKGSVALAKGGISAAELLACVPGKSVALSLAECSGQSGRGQACSGQAGRRRVEMPSTRPTLDDEPVDPEALLENLSWTEGQSKPSRTPGVDRRRPFEPVPIEPPTPSPPRLPVEAVELPEAFSGGSSSSIKPARGNLDPQLRRLMDAWPAVPPQTREAILALIDGGVGRKVIKSSRCPGEHPARSDA